MTDVTLWHNPRCSKSRQALALLEGQGHSVTLRRYLDDPPGADELRAALTRLGLPAHKLVRLKEPEAKARGLGADTDPETLIAAMAATPKLIERPVAFAKDRAALGRPPEAVLTIV